jgi:hypothetical protein
MSDRFDRIVSRTARRISRELDSMVNDLPPDAAASAALECVVHELAELQPWFMHLLMENSDLKESYFAAVARIPADPKRRRC